MKFFFWPFLFFLEGEGGMRQCFDNTIGQWTDKKKINK